MSPQRCRRRNSQPMARAGDRMIYSSAVGVAALPTCAMKASLRERCDALMASSAEHDPAAADHRDVIGDLLHLLQQVGREQHGSPFTGDGANDGAEDVAADDRIEAGR